MATATSPDNAASPVSAAARPPTRSASEPLTADDFRVCGTVDMIGSRLLFSGYGIGFKSRPLHAGFLGQDVLLVQDEAHLEPAFQELIVILEREQHEKERAETMPWPKLRVMELTATSRGGRTAFALSDQDRAEPEVRKRIEAKKTIHLHENWDEKKLAEEIAALALRQMGLCWSSCAQSRT